jgi:2,3-bisphosphoglycerate-dependent phosphoglycerate mutase
VPGRGRRRNDISSRKPADPRCATLPPDARPRTESLRDVTGRLLPYWYDVIVPDLLAQDVVLVVSHGNTLRALVKHLEGVSDSDSSDLSVPNARPIRYSFPHFPHSRHGGS